MRLQKMSFLDELIIRLFKRAIHTSNIKSNKKIRKNGSKGRVSGLVDIRNPEHVFIGGGVVCQRRHSGGLRERLDNHRQGLHGLVQRAYAHGFAQTRQGGRPYEPAGARRG